MIVEQPERIDMEILRDIAADMRGDLDRVQEQMAELTREHNRAKVLKEIFRADPLTRDRFNLLHANIDQFPGKMAELQEGERLLTRWLDRCRDLLELEAARQWRRDASVGFRAILRRGRGPAGRARAG